LRSAVGRFPGAHRRVQQEHADIVGLSVDPLDKAVEMIEKTGATFPLGYGLKVPEDADKVGAYWEDDAKLSMRQIPSSIQIRK
jgi:hypothetical protein